MRFCNEVLQGFGAELEVGTSRRVEVWWGRLTGRGYRGFDSCCGRGDGEASCSCARLVSDGALCWVRRCMYVVHAGGLSCVAVVCRCLL